MARIYWKPKELEKVADWLIERGYRSTDVGIFKPTLEAQKAVLPPDRWRNIPNNSGVITLREVMADREKKQPRIEPAGPTAAHEGYVPIQNRPIFIGESIEPTPEEEFLAGLGCTDDTVTIGPTVESSLPFGYIPPSVGSALGEYIASVIISAVTDEVDTIVNAMKEEIRRRVDAEFGERAIRKPEVVQQKQRLPRVVIVGSWPSQFGHIQSEFSDCFDFDLVSPDDSLQQLQATAKHADYVITVTSKISHRHTDALKAVGVQPIEIGGGVTAIRDRLTKIFVEEQKDAA